MCDLCNSKRPTTEYDVSWQGREVTLNLCNNCWIEIQFNLNICEEIVKKFKKEL